MNAATNEAVQQYGNANGLLYSELVDSLRTAASDSEYKRRWVDQTPEYSFHICGLRKLFPCALFIHIVRDVGSVVRSMLNFHRIAGTNVVANEEEAWKLFDKVSDWLGHTLLMDSPEFRAHIGIDSDKQQQP